MGATCLSLALASGSLDARAQETAPDKRVDFGIAFSILWLASPLDQGPKLNAGVGVLPLEIGVGWRPSSSVRLGLFARLGVAHAGVGLELSATTRGTWSEDGVVFRLAPQVVFDVVTCFSLWGRLCGDYAQYVLADVGFAYRWVKRSGGGFSIGAAVDVGLLHINLDSDPGTSKRVWNGFALGLLAPRFAWEF